MGAYHACLLAINDYFLHPDNTRGNGVLCEVLIDMYNTKFGTNLDYKNYCIHHRNGLHEINTCDNIALLNTKNITHQEIHSGAVKGTMCEFAKLKGAKPGFKIPSNLFKNMSLNDQYQLLSIFIKICTLRTDRKKNNLDVILASDLI